MKLLLQENRLCCTLEDMAGYSHKRSAMRKKSLKVLIDDGAFLPRSSNYFLGKQTVRRYTTLEKRALATKLGYCLMDFFDYYLSPHAINFFVGGRSESQDDGPYLSFTSEPPSPTFRVFRLGHPVLLSFAKLLLEINDGCAIGTTISPQHDDNAQGWFDLTRCLENLERDSVGFYLEAIRGCLTVHHQIAKSLDFLQQSHSSQGDADFKIRENIYQHIVRNLELELEIYIPRRLKERSRPESPPSSQCCLTGEDEGRAPKRARRDHGTLPDTKANWNVNHSLQPPEASSHHAGQLPRHRDDFSIAIICALPLEFDAVINVLDEFWDRNVPLDYTDSRADTYMYGRLGKYNVILALLSGIGKVSAASVATDIHHTFRSLKLSLLVGMCGGIPHGRKRDMLLGDVVISKSIVHYDFGWQYDNGFQRKRTITDGTLHPNRGVRHLIAEFETDSLISLLEKRTSHFLQEIQSKVDKTEYRGKYTYPGASRDRLFQCTYRHKHQNNPKCCCRESDIHSKPVCEQALKHCCEELGCSSDQLIERTRLQKVLASERSDDSGGEDAWQPLLHVGIIGTGDSVIKSAKIRDELSEKEGVIAFEMEAAGIWNDLPCIVVKGVADYADSHKQKEWQSFAAATAASAAKAILERY